MDVLITSQLAEKISGVQLGIIELNVTVMITGKSLWDIIEQEIERIHSSIKLEEVNKSVNIAATRHFYKLCGKDPNRYRPSADSLYRRIVKGNGLYRVNNVVDVLNLISLRSGISIGGYDCSKISGKVHLDIGRSDDEYIGIGRGKLNIEGLPVLRDEIGVFGSPTSDSERTMISEKCKKVCFVFFDFGQDKNLSKYLEDTIHLLGEFTEGQNIEHNIQKL